MSRIAQKIIEDYKTHYSLSCEPASASHLEDCIDSAVAELTRERDNLRTQRDDYEQELERHSTDRVNQRAEVAALRKALEDAPHHKSCAIYTDYTLSLELRRCDCWRSRIPQPTLNSLAASPSADGRAGKQ